MSLTALGFKSTSTERTVGIFPSFSLKEENSITTGFSR